MTLRPSDRQLKRIAEFVAQASLEVERGDRPPEQLREIMTPAVWDRWQQHQPPGRLPGGAVQRGDIGPAHVTRLSDDHVVASVTIRTTPGRWGALSFRFEQQQGRWAVTELQRLRTASHYRNQPGRQDTAPRAATIEDKIRRTHQDREQAYGALKAASRRLEDQGRRHPHRAETARTVASWRKVVADLDRELADLRTRQQTRHTIQRAIRRSR